MVDFNPFEGGEIERAVDSTEAQREIWLAVKFGGSKANVAYNESITLKLNGPLDLVTLSGAIDFLLQRHDALRSTFSADGNTLIVNSSGSTDYKVLDFRGLSEDEKSQECVKVRDAEVRQVFDLIQGPLIRFRLLRLFDSWNELVLTAHHIICDGWSLGVIVSELCEYFASNDGAIPTLSPAPSFADHAIHDRESSFGSEADKTELYWMDVLGEQPPELILPTDKSRIRAMEELDGVPTRNVSAFRMDRIIGEELTSEANALAKTTGVGLSALTLAVFSILLRRLSGQNEFVVGLPAAAQAYTGQFGLVGHCVQMLPILIKCDSNTTVTSLAKSIKLSLLEGFENQGMTFGTLLQRLRLERDPSRVPLIPVMFNLDQEFDVHTLGSCELEVFSNPRVSENFEIFLNVSPIKGRLVLEATHREELFHRDTMEQWLECFEATLSSVVNDPDKNLSEVSVLSDRQQSQQIELWNDTARDNRTDQSTVFSRILNVSNSDREKVAVTDKDESITYGELQRRAFNVAAEIVSAGASKGEFIGISRSSAVNMVVGLLAIWRAGCAYVPLDPDYPDDRLQFVLKDAGVKIILGEGESAPDFAAHCHWLINDGKTGENDVERALQCENFPASDDIAYVIHTSGSTGQPKGVLIDHSALDNFMAAMARRPGIGSEDVLVAVTSLSFDISTLEIFLPLIVGAQVVLASREQVRDGFALAKLLNNCNASIVQATPSGWRLLLDAGWNGNSKIKALCGGEDLPLTLATELSNRVGSLWNMYGPTEATVWSTVSELPKNPDGITLGQPLDNTSAFVLDDALKLLPPGADGGELFLGGAGLARGYLNNPDLTTECFIPHPFSSDPDARLYRTGDRAKIDASGNLYFKGRKDHQVKIRGFRVEMGEIEFLLGTVSGVSGVIAAIHRITEEDDRLVVYVTRDNNSHPTEQEILSSAQRLLPPQCIPQHIVFLDSFPLTSNEKIDRKALPSPIVATTVEPIKLSGETQNQLGAIWCELLHLNAIGPQDDFFLVGGHSMVAVRMFARIREKFGLELPLQTIFRDRNIANLSARIDLLEMHQNANSDHTAEDLEIIEF